MFEAGRRLLTKQKNQFFRRKNETKRWVSDADAEHKMDLAQNLFTPKKNHFLSSHQFFAKLFNVITKGKALNLRPSGILLGREAFGPNIIQMIIDRFH